MGPKCWLSKCDSIQEKDDREGIHEGEGTWAREVGEPGEGTVTEGRRENLRMQYSISNPEEKICKI